MTDDEKTAWTSALAAGVGLLAYVAYVLTAVGRGIPVSDIDFAFPLLGCIFAVVVHVWLMRASLLRASDDRGVERDERDLEIARRGDQVRHQALLLACAIVLSLALSRAEPFWIAGALFGGVALSLVAGAAAQISGYRNGVISR